MKTYFITDFKTGGTAPSLYNTVGFGAVKHGDNRLKNVIQPTKDVKISPDNLVGYDTTNMELRSFTYLSGYAIAAGKALTGLAYGELYRYDTSLNAWAGFTSGATYVHSGGIAAYQDYVYGYAALGYLWRCDIVGNFTNTWQTIGAFSTSAKPVVHFGGKILYFFTDNKVHQLRDATFTASVLEFQPDFDITTSCEHGNYLLICGYESKTGRATAAFWDRDSSLARITNVVDLGEGIPYVCGSIDGTPTVVLKHSNRLIIRQFDTNSFVTRATFDNSFAFPSEGFIEDNELFFGLKSGIRSDDRDVTTASTGSYIYKVSSSGELSQIVHNTLNDNQAQVAAVFKYNNSGTPVYFMAHKQFGTYETSRDGYLQPLIFETLAIRNIADSRTKIHAVTVTTTPLSASGTVTVKARKNAETAWTTLKVFTEDSDITHSLTQSMIRNGGASMGDAKVIQLRIEVTGGADLTGVFVQFDEPNKEPYERTS